MKIIKSIIAVFVIVLLFSCNKTDVSLNHGFSTIKGIKKTENPKVKAISLWSFDKGVKYEAARVALAKDNEYGFIFQEQKQGFYALGDLDNHTPIYLTGKQNLNINIGEDNSLEYLGDIDKENKIVSKWHQLVKPLDKYYSASENKTTYSPEEFFTEYEKLLPKMKSFRKNVSTSNKGFNKDMLALIDIQIANIPMLFLNSLDENVDLPTYYNEVLNDVNFDTTKLLSLPNGIESLKNYFKYKLKLDTEKSSQSDFYNALDIIKNDTLRGYTALNYVVRYKKYDNSFIDFTNRYKKEIALDKFVSDRISYYSLRIKDLKPGAVGYPFTAEDINGKEVSFNDFKGKIVYIDLWATWCGPCKKQIPFLKKLEKELHGKDIVIISLSLDKKKDKEKWKQFVKKEALTGVQLFAGDAFQSQIAKYYKITAIPRFLLFDKEGKILSTKAPPPSFPKLKGSLLKLLK